MHRTIIVVDVEGFGNRLRTNEHQVNVRAGLYRAVRRAFDTAGVPWGSCHREDRGDGVFILAPAETAKAHFVVTLPHALAEELREHNATHRPEERIRVRMALHAGEVTYDQHGVTAASINLAFRLLDARPLKAALAESPGVLALITSEWFHDEVVRHSEDAAPATYRPVRVAVKETSAVAWICLPDHPYPPDAAQQAEPVQEHRIESVPPQPPAVQHVTAAGQGSIASGAMFGNVNHYHHAGRQVPLAPGDPADTAGAPQ
ncbi:nucleotidyl cyclase domain-containing protein [Saccharothrix variisporea]|uniref:hypothetical protein n=1 Tax=Saccharothrix variisporea TaxID=543527 RepID=UPI0011C3BB9A|nr:hypothetical protein [Saccharothrix variisporea]